MKKFSWELMDLMNTLFTIGVEDTIDKDLDKVNYEFIENGCTTFSICFGGETVRDYLAEQMEGYILLTETSPDIFSIERQQYVYKDGEINFIPMGKEI